MKTIKADLIRKRKRRIRNRLEKSAADDRGRPLLNGGNTAYELAQKASGTAYGGVAAIHVFAKKIGLPKRIDDALHLFKVHLPYHESDQVLNLAYNALCGGTCLEDIELRRNDESLRNSIGAERIPDPTIAGDFCRRFDPYHIDRLQDAFDQVRLDNWQSNWAYMVTTALSWNLKAWIGLSVPVDGRWREQHQQERHNVIRMELKQFVEQFVRFPAQIVRGGWQLVVRLLSRSESLRMFSRWLCFALE